MKKSVPISLIGILIFMLVVPLNSVFGATTYPLVLPADGYKITLSEPLKNGDVLKIVHKSTGYFNSGKIFLNGYELAMPVDTNQVLTTNITVSADKTQFAGKKELEFKPYFPTQTGTIIEFTINGELPKEYVKEYKDISDLTSIPSSNSVYLTWINPDDLDFTGAKIYKNGAFLTSVDTTINTYIDSDVLPNTSYIYRVTGLYADSHETDGISKTIITLIPPTNPEDIPPSNVTALKVSEISNTTALLSWTNPLDDDLDFINIYKADNTLLAKINITDSYLLENLEPDTDYKFFVSVLDRDGNESGKVPIVFKTMFELDDVPPSVPKNLTVEGGSNSIYVSWDRFPETDVNGYNVYVDGVKNNLKPIKSLFYAIPNLENDREYSITVSAVDRSGNESQQSLALIGIPIASGMPILSTKYDLKDIAVGVEKWFSSYWLIVAFATAIPLAFYIASRIKLMFLE